MAPRISLALTLHNHQPVGNFGWVLADVYEHAYEPMLDALDRHPSIHVGLHYSGALLEWLRTERPEAIDRLRGLVERDQVEIVGGGYYEPVLTALPERDRIGQLLRMGDELEELFGRRPVGAWLAERVWEPDLPTSLVAAGYRWTILDDAHFRAAAVKEEDLWGPYTTEDQGHLLRVFGTEQGLRYRIPFREVKEVIDYLHDHATEAGDRLGTMGDDGEKFGAWPTTWEHCWGKRHWIERFFGALEANADWLATTTPSAWLAGHAPIGRAYIPTGSYAEMGEWALPPDESRVFAPLLHRAQARHRPEARWLRGAFWRNFQVKYREINDLHKQMLRISAKVAAMAPGADREAALDHLYQGQSNDCYWHGLFGGIYLSHMRLATLEHLIAAEDVADSAAGRLDEAEVSDLDMDGREDVRLSTAGQVVTIHPEEGAGIGAWDVRPVRHALTSVLRRRPEAYHDRLRESDSLPPAAADGAVTSIHDTVKAKEPGLADRLRYDHHERRSGLLRFLDPSTEARTWADAEDVELGDALDQRFELVELGPASVTVHRDATVAGCAVRITKRFEAGGGRLDPTLALTVDLVNVGSRRLDARFGVEWSITMLGGGGNPAAWWEVDGERTGHDASGTATGIASIGQGNDHIGVSLRTAVSLPAEAWWAPIETISNSEDGFERVYQGSGLLLSWLLALEPGATWSVKVTNEVVATLDRRPASVSPGHGD